MVMVLHQIPVMVSLMEVVWMDIMETMTVMAPRQIRVTAFPTEAEWMDITETTVTMVIQADN